jgi:hypothetical protein
VTTRPFEDDALWVCGKKLITAVCLGKAAGRELDHPAGFSIRLTKRMFSPTRGGFPRQGSWHQEQETSVYGMVHARVVGVGRLTGSVPRSRERIAPSWSRSDRTGHRWVTDGVRPMEFDQHTGNVAGPLNRQGRGRTSERLAARL